MYFNYNVKIPFLQIFKRMTFTILYSQILQHFVNKGWSKFQNAQSTTEAYESLYVHVGITMQVGIIVHTCIVITTVYKLS